MMFYKIKKSENLTSLKKHLLLHLLLGLIPFCLNAQSMANPTIIPRNYYEFDQSVIQNFNSLRHLGSDYSKGLIDKESVIVDGLRATNTKIKDGKKYKNISFTLDGRKLYTSGKVNVNATHYGSIQSGSAGIKYYGIIIYPDNDILYQGSNKVFAKKEDINGSNIISNANIYYENGTPIIESLKDSTGTFSIKAGKTPDGQYLFRLQTLMRRPSLTINNQFGNYYANYLYLGAYDQNYIAPQANELSIIYKPNGDYYSGYSTAGTYHSVNHGSFTGYMLPLQYHLGNGSVLFRELNGKYDWVIMIDGNIEMAIPAKAEDKPALDALMSDQITNLNTISFPFYPMNEAVKNRKTLHYGTIFGDFKSSPETLNGYGLRFHTSDSLFKGDHAYMEVGFFKDGQLNGLGYRVNLKHNYETGSNSDGTGYIGSSQAYYKVFAPEVNAFAGIFENGSPIKGRKIYIPNDISAEFRNNWNKPSINGFDWTVRGKEPIDFSEVQETTPFTSMNMSQIYVQKLNRTLDVLRVDQAKKALVVKGDNNQEVLLDKNSGPLYKKYRSSTAIKNYCPKTIEKKNYKEITINHEIPRYVTKTRKVNGALVNYYYSNTYYEPIRFASKKTVFDNYQTVTCPKCKGLGYTFSDIRNDNYTLVSFE